MVQRPESENFRARPAAPKNSTSRVDDPVRHPAEQLEFDLVRFRSSANKPVELKLDLWGETIWATTAQIADLFGVSAETVAHHIAALQTDSDGMDEKLRSRAGEANAGAMTATSTMYDLDVVLGVGYRVSSSKAAALRKWASTTLRAFVVDGYAINEARLRDDPAGTNRLAARLRTIRASETNVYDSVRAFFEAASSDYDATSRAARSFSALLEAKFYFAATGETAAEIVLERADHEAPAMGLRRFEGDQPSIRDARIARNYLDRDELHVMHMLCEQFLLFIESAALRGQRMTMQELNRKLDALLRLENCPVLPSHKSFHEDRAVRHAQAEFARFIMRRGPGTAPLAKLGESGG